MSAFCTIDGQRWPVGHGFDLSVWEIGNRAHMNLALENRFGPQSALETVLWEAHRAAGLSDHDAMLATAAVTR